MSCASIRLEEAVAPQLFAHSSPTNIPLLQGQRQNYCEEHRDGKAAGSMMPKPSQFLFRFPFLLKLAAINATFHGLTVCMSTSNLRLQEDSAYRGPVGGKHSTRVGHNLPLWRLSRVQFHVGVSGDPMMVPLPQQIGSLRTGNGLAQPCVPSSQKKQTIPAMAVHGYLFNQ